MDQETAKRHLFEGAIFLFLGVPEGTEFGIDLKSWNTGENFRGVKMIPPGLHYIYYSATSSTGDIAPRSGFFYNFKKSEFLVKKWDKTTEDISSNVFAEAEIVRLKENYVQIDKFLGPYPFDVHVNWQELSTHLNDELIKKLSPESGHIRSAMELVSTDNEHRPRGSLDSSDISNKRCKRTSKIVQETDNLLPHLKPVDGTEIRFTKFPEYDYPEGATPAEITQHSLDSTYVLQKMIEEHKSPLDFLGELQFAFICFLIGHSLEAFDHWKDLVGLICSCEKAITKYRELYDCFVPVLEAHINKIPAEFLADIVSNNNFVYIKLRSLFRTVHESNVDGRLKTKMARFKEELTSKFGWDFSNLEQDDDDEAPVIVEM